MSGTRPSLRLLLGGDVMLGRLVAGVLSRQGAGYPFSALSGLVGAEDLFFVNLECAITAQQQLFGGTPKAFYFCADPDAVSVLTSAGVDLVSLANNHALDADVDGLTDTLAILARHGIACAGAGANLSEAASVRAIDHQGQSLGVLAVCDHQEDFAASDTRPGIHYLNLRDSQDRRRLVERVHTEAPRFDHLIVSLHWLPNWVPSIPHAYRQLAHDLIEAGARVVWGHSPHHILGAEWWSGGVALYSTGDLIDDYALDATYRNDRQLLYLLELSAEGVDRLTAFPIVLDMGRAQPADLEARQWIERRLRGACQRLGSEVAAAERDALEILPGFAGGAHVAAGLP